MDTPGENPCRPSAGRGEANYTLCVRGESDIKFDKNKGAMANRFKDTLVEPRRNKRRPARPRGGALRSERPTALSAGPRAVPPKPAGMHTHELRVDQ